LAWPEVVETQGCAFLREGLARSGGVEAIEDRTGREAFVNHVHILDEIQGGDPPATPGGDLLAEAWHIALIIARIWGAKLGREFPSSSFRVYATRDDEPIVRFHRCYRSEAPWLGSVGPITDESQGIFVQEIAGNERTR
jgi:hypothetical protein